jgi:parallel beta-helix repeat protein
MGKSWIFLIFCFFILVPIFARAQDFDEFLMPSIPGRVEGKGKYFQIKDSDYLNISLESSGEIEVVLESIPRMISLDISSSIDATTTLTIKGLEPNKTYFKYQDSYKEGAVFVSDENGTISWQQDLTEPHHIWIQEEKGTIFIPEDCTSTLGTWDETTRICTLTQDVTTSIEITTSSIIFDCQNRNITSEGTGYGIYLENKRNVTIKNCYIKNFIVGILSTISSNLEISSTTIVDNEIGISITGNYGTRIIRNKLSDNREIGIQLSHIGIYQTNYVEVNDNIIEKGRHGILINSSNNKIINNKISKSTYGLRLHSFPETTIENNDFLESGIFINFWGTLDKLDLFQNNTVNGKPIFYCCDQSNIKVENAGQVISVKCQSIVIENLNLSTTTVGVQLIDTDDSIIKTNIINSNFNSGIYLFNSSSNLIENNIISENAYPERSDGIYVYQSSNNLILKNEISNNFHDVVLYESWNNKVFHNNFKGSKTQGVIYRVSVQWGGNNSFDDGYPSGGNYWSDYTGSDANGDGIGDSPYCFEGGCDNFPFMKENGWVLTKVLISEVYFNPDSLHGATGTNEWMNEWIEIRNLEDREVDISGWTIRDNNATTIIPNSSIIPQKGFAIITPSNSTFDFWPEIPEGTIKIVLGNKIGNGLANEHDFLILRDQNGKIIDSVCWGREEECVKESFNYACLKTKEGYSLEKKPFVLKQNTDFCSFFEQENPNPGKNVLDFYWHREIVDPEDSQKGYEILSAQAVKGDDKILNFLPPFGGGLCETLIAKLELREILNWEDYTFIKEEEEEIEGYGGVAMKLDAGAKIYLFAFDLSSKQYYLLVSFDGGKSWQLDSSNTDYFIYQFGEREIFFALNLEKISPPQKVSFLSGFVFADFSDYRIFDQTEEILLFELENQPPIPIINFSPKNPVKGVKVKFDASSSTDTDGKILKFEWQIGTSTFSGTTTEFTFNENGDYEIILTATDNEGATSSASTTVRVQPFSFAIITDLHIGRGYPDYDSSGFDDSDEGEDYYLTERLKNVVQWIIDNRDNVQCENATCSIKFLAVLGDIADSGEKSEFLKAKKILDRLNEYSIPYVPVFGNHDIWPYTDFDEATTALGENYFDEIFWSENATNTKLMKEILGFKRDESNKNYKNFAFSLGGINFIGLDFVKRTEALGKGVFPSAEISTETELWFTEHLKSSEPTIILSHHPFIMDPANSFISNEISEIDESIKISGAKALVEFAGHVHSFEEWYGKWPENANIEYPAGAHWYTPANIPVVTTEAIMVGSNEQDPKGIIRVVKVLSASNLNYNNWENTLTDTEFVALNPQFEWYISKIGPQNEPLEYTFVANYFTKREISSFDWEFFNVLKKSGEKVIIPIDTLLWSPRIDTTKVKVPVKLTLTDSKTQKNEYMFRNEIIDLGRAFYLLLGPNNQAISLKTGLDLSLFPENRENITVQINEVHSEPKPVGLIEVNFNQATSNVDLTDLIARSDLQKRKSILYLAEWPNEIGRLKAFFIPSSGAGSIYLCPHATSLDEITPLCEDIEIINVGELINGKNVILIEYGGQEYYLVFGIEGTGGGEFGPIEKTIKEINDYIQGLPAESFKNNSNQKKIALKNKLEKVFVKIENQEYQDAINKLRNDIRAKADGSIDGNPKNDWIIDFNAQKEICGMIDNLINYLKGLF